MPEKIQRTGALYGTRSTAARLLPAVIRATVSSERQYNRAYNVRMGASVECEVAKSWLHDEIAASIEALITHGTYRPGDRIPSIRQLSRQMRVSINTVMQAYAHLEDMRLIEARPQSGYYVCRASSPRPRHAAHWQIHKDVVPLPVTIGDAPLQVMRNIADPSLVPLGRGTPNPKLLPIEKLNRMLATQVRRFPVESVSYTNSNGSQRLRTQIAKRVINSGCQVSPDEVLVTSGCIEAISLALRATCQPGDTVAVASPVFYTFLNSIQWLGLKVLEIPSTPQEGMNLEVLNYAIEHNPVHACLIISNFDNPVGALMPDEKKKELVRILARHEIPLIEDDVYGDLHFGPRRPIAAKAFDKDGLVLLCSSFSKTLAPGYRIGWILPGIFRRKVEGFKTLFNIATASPTQLAVAEFLTNGGYDRHLRTIRRTYARQVENMCDAVLRYFPPGTKITRPEGGFIIWVQLPEEVDSNTLYEEALKKGISIAPGSLFALDQRFGNYIRLNAAFWSDEIEKAIDTLGRLAFAQV